MRALLLGLFITAELFGAAAAAEPLDPRQIPELVARLGDAEVQVRATAAEELGRFGSEAKIAVPALVRMLADEATYPGFLPGLPLKVYDRAFLTLIDIGSESVAGLSGALEDPSAGARNRAAEALGRIGPRARPALPMLLKAATDRDWSVRSLVVQALPKIDKRGDQSVPVLLERLRDEDHNVREAALFALAEYRDRSHAIVPAILPLLSHEEPKWRGHAAQALGRLAKSPDTVVPALLARLDDRADYLDCYSCGVGGNCVGRLVAEESARALGAFGADARPATGALVRILAAEPDALGVLAGVEVALAALGPAVRPFVPKLAEMAQQPETPGDVRRTILWIFRRMGSDAEAAIPKVRKLFEETRDDDAPGLEVRIAAACALVTADFAGQAPAWRYLVAQLESIGRDRQTNLTWRGRDMMLETVDSLGSRAVAAAPVLTRLLDATSRYDAPLGKSIVVALGRIGPAASEAAGPLVAWLDGSLLHEGGEAAQAVVGLGPGAIPALVAGLEEFADDERHCAEILSVLGQFGEKAASALPSVLRSTQDGRRDVRAAAARALGRLHTAPETSIPLLVRLLADERPQVREQAALALGDWKVAPASVVAALTTALKDDFIDVRVAAAEALGNIGPGAQSSVPALRAARADSNELVRDAVAIALQKIK